MGEFDEKTEQGKEIDNNAEIAAAYGKCFFGFECNQDKLEQIISTGVVPEKWMKESGFNNTSYDSVCFTIVPDGANAEERFKNMSTEVGNMNHFVSKIIDGNDDENISIGLLMDLEEAEEHPSVKRVVPNGHMRPEFYPSDSLPGLDDRAFSKAKRGGKGGFNGEVRLNFDDNKDNAGYTQDYWKGLVVNSDNFDKLKSWVDETKRNGVIVKNTPVYDQDMNYLGKL